MPLLVKQSNKNERRGSIGADEAKRGFARLPVEQVKDASTKAVFFRYDPTEREAKRRTDGKYKDGEQRATPTSGCEPSEVLR